MAETTTETTPTKYNLIGVEAGTVFTRIADGVEVYAFKVSTSASIKLSQRTVEAVRDMIANARTEYLFFIVREA